MITIRDMKQIKSEVKAQVREAMAKVDDGGILRGMVIAILIQKIQDMSEAEFTDMVPIPTKGVPLCERKETVRDMLGVSVANMDGERLIMMLSEALSSLDIAQSSEVIKIALVGHDWSALDTPPKPQGEC